MFRYIITSLCLGWVLAAPAMAQQTGTVEGVVVAAGSGFPLAGATARIAGSDRLGALTDSRGVFRIANVPVGAQTLIIESYGWETARRNIEVHADLAPLRVQLMESPVHVAGVVVTATGAAQRQMTSSASVGAVTARELRETRPSHPAQIAGRVPGVYVNVAGSGEGHMTAIRQPLTTAPVYLFLEDGVPTRSTGFFNHNALYEINVPQAARMEVLKGPGTALYGSDAIGGVINVETQAPADRSRLDMFAENGSYGWNRALFSFSGSHGANGVRADLNLTSWDGWRDGTGYSRESGSVRWDHRLGANARVKTLLTYSQIGQVDPSGLPRAQFESAPDLNYFLITTRDIKALRASSEWELKTGATTLSATPFVRDNRMDIVPSWMLSFDPVMYESGHRSAGILLRARHEWPALRVAVTGGLDVDHSPGFRTEHRIQFVRDGQTYTSYQPGALIYDYDVTFNGVSPYVQAEVAPLASLHLTAGLRYDRVGYSYNNHLDAVSTGPHRRPADTTIRYDEISPKLGAAWELKPWLGVFGSYRESFRAPSESQIFRQGSSLNTTALEPIRAHAYEAGARGLVAGRFDYEISAYELRVHDDVLTFIRPDNARETQNAGETRHRGIELGAGAQLAGWLRFDASQAWTDQTYVEWRPRPTLSFAGNEIERAPRALTNLRARVKSERLNGATATVEWVRIGGYWENPENTSRYHGHALLNLFANVPLKWGVTAVARAHNLTDARYAEYATYNSFEGEQLTPGAPRLIYIGLQGSWPR